MNKPWDYLIREASKARGNAHAPYSHFKVGAAVEGESGKIYTGCNVENASYGLSICAERTAICNAISQGEKQIKAIAIVTSTKLLTPPCGACRQFIQEFGPDAVVILSNLEGDEKVFAQGNLLPSPFDATLLK
jgi:cytidine deaminase